MNEEEKKAPAKPKLKKAPVVKLVSYGIKMTIPTDNYANVQPEIIVKASSLEDAHNYIAPHMNKLWKEYFLIGKRRKEVAPQPVVPNKVVTQQSYAPLVASAPVAPAPVAPPTSSVALVKATQAVESCMSIDALDLIGNQVNASIKLTEEDKKILTPLILDKRTKLLEVEFNAQGRGK